MAIGCNVVWLRYLTPGKTTPVNAVPGRARLDSAADFWPWQAALHWRVGQKSLGPDRLLRRELVA